MRWQAILLIVPVMLSGCDIFESHDCQLLGCVHDELSVDFVGSPEESFILTATAANGEVRTLDCSSGCEVTEFGGFAPGRVTIEYESEARTVEHTFRPEYERSYPNGQGCGVCAWAIVEFDLGEEA